MRGRQATAKLSELRRILTDYGEEASAAKRACLAALGGARLPTADDVAALHEALCFLRAHPDDAELLARVETLLRAFASRADLARFAAELADSGIAGTDTTYAFYAPMAGWLARRFGDRLEVDWDVPDDRAARAHLDMQLKGWLETLVSHGELPALYEKPWSARQWIERLKGPDETDAAFLVRSFEGLDAAPAVRRRALEVLDVVFRLRGSADGPSRTLAYHRPATVHFQTGPLRTARPDLAAAWARKPRSIRAVSPREGARLVDLAREAMATRGRDLDSFAYGDPRDVRLVDCGDGLVFAAIGLRPEQRLVLESVYGFLTLQNGVPIGYVLASALWGSSEIAYNVFDTWRGGEAGHVYGCILGMLRALFGSDAFTVYPYQLGHKNDEGLASGAWWFYQKLGFRARHPQSLQVMRAELLALRRDPAHRSSKSTLKTLAAHNVFWSAGPPRDDVIGVFPSEELGLAITDLLAGRYGSDRRRGERELGDEAAERLGVSGWRRWPAAERRAWERWGPLLALLPHLERWNAANRRALVRVVRAKAGRRETDFVRLFDGHRPLRQALLRLARELVA